MASAGKALDMRSGTKAARRDGPRSGGNSSRPYEMLVDT